jgi:hypothetical protein
MLFWLCWIIDVLLILLVMAGSNFRSGFGAGNDFNNMALLVLLVLLLASILTRILVRPKWVSLVLAALPILLLLVFYLFDKNTD